MCPSGALGDPTINYKAFYFNFSKAKLLQTDKMTHTSFVSAWKWKLSASMDLEYPNPLEMSIVEKIGMDKKLASVLKTSSR